VFAFLDNRHRFRMGFRGGFELGQIREDHSQLTLQVPPLTPFVGNPFEERCREWTITISPVLE